MQTSWFARLFFAVVAALAVGGVVGGAACTRWGQPGPAVPSLAPLSAVFVNASTGSDTTGNGSMLKPYKTLTKAVAVVTAAKVISPNGVTISLASGNYDAANGETFPIVVTKSVTIGGTNFGSGPGTGSFVNGLGEDTNFERAVGAPARSAFATLEVLPPATLSTDKIYVGATKISLPGSKAFYASVDALGIFSGSTSSLGAGIVSPLSNVDGVIVPGGSFNCDSCQIHGNDFGIGGIAIPLATASPYASPPAITLTHSLTDSTVSARIVDIATDGSVDVTASGETFLRGLYAYADALTPILPGATRGIVDFGGGFNGSSGLNAFIGARKSEIFITRRNELVTALDDTWNPNQQGANRNGRYPRKRIFAAGASGKNVTVRNIAVGSSVTVGPAIVPTPTPSITPSTSPSPSPT